MSRKNAIVSYHLAENQSLAAGFTSSVTHISFLDNIGVQIVVSGVVTNAGQFAIEASIDEVNWQAITLSPVISPLANNNPNILVNLNMLPFKALRVTFASPGVGADGICNIWLSAKEL